LSSHRRFQVFRAAALFLIAGQLHAQGTVSTVAGGTPFVLKPEGMPATQAPLQDIGAIAVDGSNRLYVAVTQGAGVGLIMRIQPDGTFHVIAGGGAAGSSGDGGPATSGYLNNPAGLAFDATGNLYIADAGAHVVREVMASGIITTVAGNGTAAFGGDGGPAISASLNTPGGLAVDASGNLYIADTLNRRIRKVDRSGAISTFAGNGVSDYAGESGGPATQAEFPIPLGLGFDPAGNLYVSDSSGRIRKISPAGNISLFAYWFDLFPGEFIPSSFGLAVDAQSNVFAAVLDTSPNDAFTPYIIKLGQNGSRTVVNGKAAPPNWPTTGFLDMAMPFCCDGVAANQWRMPVIFGKQTKPAVAVDRAGNLFFSDLGYARVRKVGGSGIITTVAGNGAAPYQGEGGKAPLASLQPQNARPDGRGNLLIADMGSHGVRLVGSDRIIHTIAGTNIPGDTGDGGPATAATLYYPADAVEDSIGNIYIAEVYTHRIRKIDSSGIITTFAGNGTPSSTGDGGPAAQATLNGPQSLAIGADGALYVAERGKLSAPGSGRVRRIGPDGAVSTYATFSGEPTALAFGPDGWLYVDVQVGAAGEVVKINGSARAAIAVSVATTGIAIDSSGTVYLADSIGQRVGRINTDGTITYFLGTGQAASTGDGGPSNQASVNRPVGLSVDGNGVLYICEGQFGGDRVRAYTPFPPLQISANGVQNAASYAGGAVAPEELVYLKGNTGATQLTVQNSSSFQFDLGGVSIQITDSTGKQTYAPLYYVAPGQAVFLFPVGIPPGSATLLMRNDDGRSTTATVTVAATAPGIFTANSSGSGPPAATVTRAAADGTSTTQYAFMQGSDGQLAPAPIDLGGAGDSTVLVLYGTGLRHYSQSVSAKIGGVDLPVLFAGSQSEFGLDQVNLQLPQQLAGSGAVNLTLMVDGQTANTVQLLFP